MRFSNITRSAKVRFLTTCCILLAVAAPLAMAEQPAAESPVIGPPRAIASLTLHNLGQIDAKIAQLGKRLDGPLATPLSLLSAIARWDNGIDAEGDFALLLVAELAGEGPSALCVQIPVSDYGQFVESLGGNAGDTVTTVQVAGQQLVATHVEQWAIVSEQKESALLERLVGNALHDLLPTHTGERPEAFDASVLLSEEAIRRLLDQLGVGSQANPAPGDDELFGGGEEDDINSEQEDNSAEESDSWIAWIASRLLTIERHTELESILRLSKTIATGLRITDDADLLLDCQLEWDAQDLAADSQPPTASLPPLHHQFAAGPFISFGGGRLPSALARSLVSNYALHSVQEIRGTEESDQEGKEAEKFVEQIDKLWESVESVAAIHRPAIANEGVYSNNFLLLRTSDAALTHTHINAAFESWNWLMDDAQDDMALQFDSENKKIAERETTEFTADMVAAVGGPPLPEVRTALESLFGPGAMMRIQVITVDANTVLLANASTTQVETLLAELAASEGKLMASPELAAAKKLLQADPPFEFYLQPHALSVWANASMTAGMENIIGGPLVREFRKSPPIGIEIVDSSTATNLRLAMPADTFVAFCKYLLKSYK